MVAYSYKPRFEEPIVAGTKLHTMRGPRRRHARPGEEIQNYVGMRTRACRLIGRRTCTQLLFVRLQLRGPGYVKLSPIAELIPGELREIAPAVDVADLDAFAIADGFGDFDELGRF